jgi:hypothetical protein
MTSSIPECWRPISFDNKVGGGFSRALVIKLRKMKGRGQTRGKKLGRTLCECFGAYLAEEWARFIVDIPVQNRRNHLELVIHFDLVKPFKR